MVLSLANELSRRNVDVTVLTARQTQEPLVTPLPQVHLRQFPTFLYYESLTIVPFYWADLVRNRYDVVVAFFADFGEGWAWRLAAPFNHSHLFLYLTFPPEAAAHRYRSYRQWGWDKQAACILADSEYTAQRGAKVLGRRVLCVPSGTDPERFKRDERDRRRVRQAYGFSDGDIVLLNVGALEKRKGAWRVIQALPDVLSQCPQVRYLVLGTGPEQPVLEQRAAELGIEKQIVFAGTTIDLPAHYSAADIFVMLSDAESGAIACLEAMASGLAVIVPNEGDFEAVDDGNGWRVHLADRTEIANTIISLAQDGSMRQRAGAAARQRVIEAYSWDKIAVQLESLCEQALTGKC